MKNEFVGWSREIGSIWASPGTWEVEAGESWVANQSQMHFCILKYFLNKQANKQWETAAAAAVQFLPILFLTGVNTVPSNNLCRECTCIVSNFPGVYIYDIHVHTHMWGRDLCSSVIFFTQMADHIALQLFPWNSPSWPSSWGKASLLVFLAFWIIVLGQV